MRVNIAYSVELDDVPLEVEKLMSDALERINDFTESYTAIESLLQENNPDSAILSLKTFRRDLFKVDQRLSDCQSVLEGYLATKYAKEQEAPVEEQEENAD